MSMSEYEFKVALGELKSAIGTVRKYAGDIEGNLAEIGRQFDRLGGAWTSPARMSSEPVTEWFKRASRDMHSLLEEMIRRMQAAYDNYLDAETTNYNNLG
ncbi:hypothetical protein GCM10010129_77150 [Streptomyces fumigatiscleroticus]|nr:hypothetical protein GCM10010129_77150 [Streptomyces fumigatiscleroticus]